MINTQRPDQENPAIATLGLSTDIEAITPGADTARDRQEIALMRAAQQDLRHFAPIYERYAGRVYAYCLRRVGSADEAEDLTSAIFARSMAALRTYRGGHVAAWLFSIARRAVINHCKARGRHRNRHTDLSDALTCADSAPEPLTRIIQDEEQRAVQALVAALPDAEQDVLLMRVAGGLTAEQIGQVIGKKPGAVRTALSRIIHKLQRQLAASEKETGDGQ